jgi:hypothetical protein
MKLDGKLDAKTIARSCPTERLRKSFGTGNSKTMGAGCAATTAAKYASPWSFSIDGRAAALE